MAKLPRTEMRTRKSHSVFPQSPATFDRRVHENISAHIKSIHDKYPNYLNELVSSLRQKLDERGISTEIQSHIPTPFELWSMMIDRGYSGFYSLEVFEVVIIPRNLGDCYQVLGVLHTTFPVMPGRFNDFISTPWMVDGRISYSSLDTVLIGPKKQQVSFKIRTREMHDRAVATERNTEDPDARYFEMLDRILALEKALSSLPPPIPGLGHNQPPEPIDLRPLEEIDREIILKLAGELREQPPVPNEKPEQIGVKAERLKAFGERVLAYVADKTETFVNEAVKSAGKETGKWTARLAIWSALGALLIAAAHAVFEWINAISPLL